MLAETVEDLLGRLQGNEWTILELSLQGYSTQEISQQTGRAEPSVRRVRDQVRRELERLEAEAPADVGHLGPRMRCAISHRYATWSNGKCRASRAITTDGSRPEIPSFSAASRLAPAFGILSVSGHSEELISVFKPPDSRESGGF